VEDLPTLVWMANLAALELHVPQWTVGPRGGVHPPDRLVVDLDPGPPAGLAECATVAGIVRARLAEHGLAAVPVTSGSKGLQLYVRLSGEQSVTVVNDYAHDLAESLAAEHPDLILAKMAKVLRPGKVLIDWSQNNPAKTTICPYSLRGRAQPWVAAPRSWDELEAPAELHQLGYSEVLARIDQHGDLAAALHQPGARLPS
jgi:bifunctional non-homologous end joining protein LigD